MSNCKISIVLPVYNTSKYLNACMDSLLAQTLGDIEIIAVNDGSTDNSLDILKQYQAENPNKVYVYNTENHGVSHARNFGAEKATGEFVWFVDSDDYVELDACEKLYNKAIKDNNDLVLFTRYDVQGDNKTAALGKSFNMCQNFTISEKPCELIKLSPFPWNKLIKRNLLNEVKFPEGIRFEDLPVAFILAQKAQCIGVINECLYDYRVQVGFLSRFSEELLDIIKAFDYLRDNYIKAGCLDEFKEEIEFVTMRHFYYRFEQILSVFDDDAYELKIKMINELFDYLDKNYPERQNNRYLHYNLPDKINQYLSIFSSREKMLQYVEKAQGKNEASQEKQRDSFADKAGVIRLDSYEDILNKQKTLSGAYNNAYNNELKNEIVFKSFQYYGISSSMLTLIIEAQKSGNYDSIIIGARSTAFANIKAKCDKYGINANVVDVFSNQYSSALATAKMIICDCPIDYFYHKRDGQILINNFSEYIKLDYIAGYGEFQLTATEKSLIFADYTVYGSEKSRNKFEKAYKVKNFNLNSIIDKKIKLDLLSASSLGNDKRAIAIVPSIRLQADRDCYKKYRSLLGSLIHLDDELDDSTVAYVCIDNTPFEFDFSVFKHIERMPNGYDPIDFMGKCDNVILTNFNNMAKHLAEMNISTVRVMGKEAAIDDDDSESAITHAGNIVQAYHKLEGSNKTDTPSSNIAKEIFDLVSSGYESNKSELDKVTVLYYLGGRLTEKNVKAFIKKIKADESRKFFLAFDQEKNEGFMTEFEELVKKRNIIPIVFDKTTDFEAKMLDTINGHGRTPLGSGDAINIQAKKEYRRYFAGLKFDEIQMYSTAELKRALMLMIGSDAKVYYSFNWYSEEKMKSDKEFKNKTSFLAKTARDIKAVKLNDEMKASKLAGKLDNIVESF